MWPRKWSHERFSPAKVYKYISGWDVLRCQQTWYHKAPKDTDSAKPLTTCVIKLWQTNTSWNRFIGIVLEVARRVSHQKHTRCSCWTAYYWCPLLKHIHFRSSNGKMTNLIGTPYRVGKWQTNTTSSSMFLYHVHGFHQFQHNNSHFCFCLYQPFNDSTMALPRISRRQSMKSVLCSTKRLDRHQTHHYAVALLLVGGRI